MHCARAKYCLRPSVFLSCLRATLPLFTKSFRKMGQHLGFYQLSIVKLICDENQGIKLMINRDAGAKPIMAPDPLQSQASPLSPLGLDQMSSDVFSSSVFILWFEGITPRSPEKPHRPSVWSLFHPHPQELLLFLADIWLLEKL